MRITGSMMTRDMLANIEKAQKRMYDLQNDIATTTRINKPSDDPVAIEKILRLKSSLDRIDQWKKNVSQAIDTANTVDDIMGNMGNMLHRTRELAVQASSDTLSEQERTAIKAEIDQISKEMLNIANSKVGGKLIFAGTKTDSAPLENENASWNGNTAVASFEVGNGVTIPVSVNGVSLFQTPITKRSDGQPAQGIFQTLQSLSQALGNNDGSGVGNAIADIDANLDNIGLHRADIGARVNRLTAAQSHLQSTEINMTQNLSNLQDTDMVKTIMEFNDQQKVYEAALSTGAKIVQMSLVDFMK